MLAHSLAAVSVNLEAAEGLLGRRRRAVPNSARPSSASAGPDPDAGGMAEARRAIQALRDDAHAAPLADQLAATLVEQWQADGDAPATSA